MDFQCIKETEVPPKTLLQMANLRGWPSGNKNCMLSSCPVDLFLTMGTFQTVSSTNILASGFLPPQYGYSHEDCYPQVNSNRGRDSLQEKTNKKTPLKPLFNTARS